MKSLQLTAWKHDPEFREVPQPDPGPGQVLVRVGGAGACHSDLHLMHDFEEGLLPWGPPFTLGHENAGWVEALGAGVEGLEVGEAVAVYGPWGCGSCHRCLQGIENYCERPAELGAAGPGLGFDGGMAPYLLVPQSRWLIPLGDLSPVEAAPLTDAGLTPYHAIARSRHLLTPGSVAVVIGVGGLGQMGVQILRALSGAVTIIAVDRRDDALQMALDGGADHTVVSGDDDAEAIRELSGGRGADLTLDFVGADGTLALGAAVTRMMGHLTIVGIGGGTLPLSFFSIPYEVSVATTYWGTLPELAEVIELARSGRIRAEVTEFGLDEALDAYGALDEGSIRGRAVIVP
jgi:alcohol dehydrogenase, propanol-preferring